MLPHSFEYLKPKSLSETLTVLDQLKGQKALVLAGGTDLIPLLRARAREADYLVDLADKGLDEVVFENGHARIGALATFATLCRDPEVWAKLPAIADAALKVGAVQCRNQATIGGNLCSGVPSLDSAPALLALGAGFRLQSKDKERMVPAEQFFLGPRRTVLQPGEILTEILVPIEEGVHAKFLKFGRRKAMTLSIVNVAAGMAVKENREMAKVRIALGAVAPTPIRAYKAEQLLEGRKASADLFAKAAAMAATEISPISDLRASADYRRKLSAVLVGRVLQAVMQ